jgi:hypothetical protein
MPHPLPGDALDLNYVNEYLDWVSQLGADQLPITLCLHPHDMNNGLYDELKSRGYRVVTAGDSSHPDFFLRWIAIAQNFRFATSPNWGSQMLLFHAMGGTYFMGGPMRNYSEKTLAENNDLRSRTPFQISLQNEMMRAEQEMFGSLSRRPQQEEYLRIFSTSGKRETTRAMRQLFLQKLTTVPASYWLRWVRHYVRFFYQLTLGLLRHGASGARSLR